MCCGYMYRVHVQKCVHESVTWVPVHEWMHKGECTWAHTGTWISVHEYATWMRANFIHFLCKVLGQRSVQKETFKKLTFKATPPFQKSTYGPGKCMYVCVNTYPTCTLGAFHLHCAKIDL